MLAIEYRRTVSDSAPDGLVDAQVRHTLDPSATDASHRASCDRATQAVDRVGTRHANGRRIMRRRHILAHLLPLALGGCFLRHGVDERRRDVPDAGRATLPDAGPALVRDAGPRRVDSGARPTPDAGHDAACVAGPTIAVTLEGAPRCEYGRYDEVALLRAEPAPALNGVRFFLDLCPLEDEDCACVATVSEVGTDLAPFWVPTQLVNAELTDRRAEFSIPARAPCATEVCPGELVFYAEYEDSRRLGVDGVLEVELADVVCRSVCHQQRQIQVRRLGLVPAVATLSQGGTTEFPGIVVRAVRTLDDVCDPDGIFNIGIAATGLRDVPGADPRTER